MHQLNYKSEHECHLLSPLFKTNNFLERLQYFAMIFPDGLKLWLLDYKICFIMIWPCDLYFDLTPSFIKIVWDFVQTNILSKFEHDWAKNQYLRLKLWFIHDLIQWPPFLIDQTNFQMCLKYCQNILEQVWAWFGIWCDL